LSNSSLFSLILLNVPFLGVISMEPFRFSKCSSFFCWFFPHNTQTMLYSSTPFPSPQLFVRLWSLTVNSLSWEGITRIPSIPCSFQPPVVSYGKSTRKLHFFPELLQIAPPLDTLPQAPSSLLSGIFLCCSHPRKLYVE